MKNDAHQLYDITGAVEYKRLFIVYRIAYLYTSHFWGCVIRVRFRAGILMTDIFFN